MSSLLTEENQSDIKYHHCCQKENQSDIKGLLPAVVLRVIKLSKNHLPVLEDSKSQHGISLKQAVLHLGRGQCWSLRTHSARQSGSTGRWSSDCLVCLDKLFTLTTLCASATNNNNMKSNKIFTWWWCLHRQRSLGRQGRPEMCY